MDKLLKLAQEHEEVFESLAFFKKAMEVVNKDQAPDSIKQLLSFFQENVLAHFHYEEMQIFPKVLKSDLLEAKQIVRELQKDHIQILTKLDKFQDYARRLPNAPTAASMKKVQEAARAAIALILSHARREDSKFFPLVKRLGIKL